MDPSEKLTALPFRGAHSSLKGRHPHPAHVARLMTEHRTLHSPRTLKRYPLWLKESKGVCSSRFCRRCYRDSSFGSRPWGRRPALSQPYSCIDARLGSLSRYYAPAHWGDLMTGRWFCGARRRVSATRSTCGTQDFEPERARPGFSNDPPATKWKVTLTAPRHLPRSNIIR